MRDDGIKQGGPRGYVTTKDLPWPIGKKGSVHIEVVPEGFSFESSVPRLRYSTALGTDLLGWFQPLEWVFPPDDPDFILSACVHDWLLEAGYDADFSDSQWLAAARKSGAPRFRARLVRLFMLLRRYLRDRWKDTD